jgi:hypothetical protein
LDRGPIGAVRQPNDKDKPTDASVRKRKRRQLEAGDLRKQLVITLGGGAAKPQDFVNPAKLDASEGACDLGKAIVEADLSVMQPIANRRSLVCFCRPWASALVAKAPKPIGVSLGVRENGAAFSGSDLLVGVKAEDGEIAETPHPTLIEFGADGFAGIFENDELMAIRELAESEHVGRNAEGMDDENGPGARGEDALDRRGS